MAGSHRPGAMRKHEDTRTQFQKELPGSDAEAHGTGHGHTGHLFLAPRVAGAMPSNTAIRGGGEGFQPIHVLLGNRPGRVCVSVCTSVCV